MEALLNEIKFLRKYSIHNCRDAIGYSYYKHYTDEDIEYILNYHRKVNAHYELSNCGIGKVMVQELMTDKDAFFWYYKNNVTLPHH